MKPLETVRENSVIHPADEMVTSQSAEDSLAGRSLSSRLPRRIVYQMPVFENVEDVDTFKIIHKLGNGGFALVWLARDLDQGRYVALKILKADAPDREEVSVLEHLKNAAGTFRITNLHETFTIHGPNGVHRCLVLDLGGPSLGHLALYCNRPPLPFLKAAARKLAAGLAALHAVGVCHSDLTHSNVLFEITGLQDWTEDDIYRHLGSPRTAPLLLLDGSPAPACAPTHVVDALDYSHLDQEHLSSNVLIADFGEAFFKDNVPKALRTPASFSAPELLFGYQPSCAVDPWALGCLIFEIHTFRVLVPTIFGSEQEALAMAIETIGTLPEAWQDSFYDRENPLKVANPGEKHRWFDDSIQRVRTLDSQILEELPGMPQDQRATFLQLLNSILTFEPRSRLPAAGVAKHLWFTHRVNDCGTEVVMTQTTD